MNEYSYKIIKRQPHESLSGYGYTLSIYKNNKRIMTNGAYATRIMAKIGFNQYMQGLINSDGIIKIFNIKEIRRGKNE